MTMNATPGSGVACGRCGYSNNPGNRFCERCGDPVELVQSPRLHHQRPGFPKQRPRVADRDATTRYLCAATHLDAEFANGAIAEYLIESTRAVPPSPGVDSVAVLREAVAARRRRKIRDAVLLVLLVCFLVANPPLAFLWLIVAVAVAASRAAGRSRAAAVVALLVAAVAVVVSSRRCWRSSRECSDSVSPRQPGSSWPCCSVCWRSACSSPTRRSSRN